MVSVRMDCNCSGIYVSAMIAGVSLLSPGVNHASVNSSPDPSPLESSSMLGLSYIIHIK